VISNRSSVFLTHESDFYCNFHPHSVILHVEYDFYTHKCNFDTDEWDFYTHECNFDTDEWDFHTQSVSLHAEYAFYTHETNIDTHECD
jgi:hypothetical protein